MITVIVSLPESFRSLLRQAQQHEEDGQLEAPFIEGLSTGGQDIALTRNFWKDLKTEANVVAPSCAYIVSDASPFLGVLKGPPQDLSAPNPPAPARAEESSPAVVRTGTWTSVTGSTLAFNFTCDTLLILRRMSTDSG